MISTCFGQKVCHDISKLGPNDGWARRREKTGEQRGCRIATQKEKRDRFNMRVRGVSPVATELAEGCVDWEKAVASVTTPTRRKERKFLLDERIACVIAGRTSERALSQTPGLWGRCRWCGHRRGVAQAVYIGRAET